jgi:hypothetical protein
LTSAHSCRTRPAQLLELGNLEDSDSTSIFELSFVYTKNLLVSNYCTRFEMFGVGIAWANQQQHQENEHEVHAIVPRIFRDRLDPLNVSDVILLRYYRFPRHVIVELCDLLEPTIGRTTGRCHAIPVPTQVLVSLRFLASGTFQNVLGDTAGVSQPTMCRIIKSFCSAIAAIAGRYIVYPLNNPARMAQIKLGKFMLIA